MPPFQTDPKYKVSPDKIKVWVPPLDESTESSRKFRQEQKNRKLSRKNHRKRLKHGRS